MRAQDWTPIDFASMWMQRNPWTIYEIWERMASIETHAAVDEYKATVTTSSGNGQYDRKVENIKGTILFAFPTRPCVYSHLTSIYCQHLICCTLHLTTFLLGLEGSSLPRHIKTTYSSHTRDIIRATFFGTIKFPTLPFE